MRIKLRCFTMGLAEASDCFTDSLPIHRDDSRGIPLDNGFPRPKCTGRAGFHLTPDL